MELLALLLLDKLAAQLPARNAVGWRGQLCEVLLLVRFVPD